jgi:hypothetical protein
MNVRELFNSKYLAAHDLGGQDVVVTIKAVVIETLDNGRSEPEDKGVIYFAEFPKGMVLNRVNSKRIAVLHSDETDYWIGERITLYPSEADFGGETVPCIRVREQAPKDDSRNGARKTSRAAAAEPVSDELAQLRAQVAELTKAQAVNGITKA